MLSYLVRGGKSCVKAPGSFLKFMFLISLHAEEGGNKFPEGLFHFNMIHVHMDLDLDDFFVCVCIKSE